MFTPTGILELPVELTWVSLDRLFAQHQLYIYETLLEQGQQKGNIPGYLTLCLVKSLYQIACLLVSYFAAS